MHADIGGAVRLVRLAKHFDWTWTGEDLQRFCTAVGWEISEVRRFGASMWTGLDVNRPEASAAGQVDYVSVKVTDVADAETPGEAVKLVLDGLFTDLGEAFTDILGASVAPGSQSGKLMRWNQPGVVVFLSQSSHAIFLRLVSPAHQADTEESIAREPSFAAQEGAEAASEAAVPSPPPVSWAEFTPRLATVLAGMPAGGVLTLSATGNRCVQFLAGWICSISGNDALEDGYTMTVADEQFLIAAGWTAPWQDPLGLWHRDLPIDWSCRDVAARAGEAMSQVLKIASPAELTVEVWNDLRDAPDLEVAVLGLRQATK